MNASRRASAAATRSATTARASASAGAGPAARIAHRDRRARVPEPERQRAPGRGRQLDDRAVGQAWRPGHRVPIHPGMPAPDRALEALAQLDAGKAARHVTLSLRGRAIGNGQILHGDRTRQRRRHLGAREHARAAAEHDLDLARARRAGDDADAERRMRDALAGDVAVARRVRARRLGGIERRRGRRRLAARLTRRSPRRSERGPPRTRGGVTAGGGRAAVSAFSSR